LSSPRLNVREAFCTTNTTWSFLLSISAWMLKGLPDAVNPAQARRTARDCRKSKLSNIDARVVQGTLTLPCLTRFAPRGAI
jgi:hypothetical protein